jgi:hypothetical protein
VRKGNAGEGKAKEAKKGGASSSDAACGASNPETLFSYRLENIFSSVFIELGRFLIFSVPISRLRAKGCGAPRPPQRPGSFIRPQDVGSKALGDRVHSSTFHHGSPPIWRRLFLRSRWQERKQATVAHQCYWQIKTGGIVYGSARHEGPSYGADLLLAFTCDYLRPKVSPKKSPGFQVGRWGSWATSYPTRKSSCMNWTAASRSIGWFISSDGAW